jgi:hypothetical protein
VNITDQLGRIVVCVEMNCQLNFRPSTRKLRTMRFSVFSDGRGPQGPGLEEIFRRELILGTGIWMFGIAAVLTVTTIAGARSGS